MALMIEILSLNKNHELRRESSAGILQLVGGKRLILSRAHCSYDWIKKDDTLKPDQDLKRANLLALEKSPFENTGVFLRNSDHGISIWSWDAEMVETHARVSSLLCVPESAQKGRLNDGFYIAECIDGYEGLFVHQGEIVLSRWWPSLPTENDWMRFAFGAEKFGADLQSLPEPVQLARKKTASRIPQNHLPARELAKMADQMRLALVAVAICLLVTLYPVGRWLHLSAESHLLNAEINELSESFDAQLEIIRERSDLAEGIAKISTVTGQRSQLIPFANAVNLITEKGGQIERVIYADDVWEMSFSTNGGFTETELVRTMEDNEYLDSVTIEADRRDNRWIAKFSNAPNS